MQTDRPLPYREFALRVLDGGPEETELSTAARMQRRYAELRRVLESLLGGSSVQVLVERALRQSSVEYRWLMAIRAPPEGALSHLEEALEGLDPMVAREGCAAVLANVTFLLVTFIGAGLAGNVIRWAWPHAASERPFDRKHDE